jgi:hypothetical protein
MTGGIKVAKKCEICNRKIGFFDSRYTTSEKKIVCKDCWTLYKQKMPVASAYKEPINEIAKYIDSKSAAVYCEKHQIINIPEKYRQDEINRKIRLKKLKEEEEKEQQRLDTIERFNEQEQKNKEDMLKRLKNKIILKFDVAGIKYHDIGKAIAFVKREKMFTPFNGANSNSLKNDPYQKYYETHLDGIISSANFDFETENEHDKNAIAVYINIKDKSFKIGYVPKRLTSKVKDIINQSNNNKIALKVGCYLDGGKFKVANEDQNDFSDNPKLKIFTGTDDLKFDIELSDDNL